MNDSDELLPLVYEELRALARSQLRREAHATLQPTMLVHEAYLRLVKPEGRAAWNGRGHFFGAAAQAMRRILIEEARRRVRPKHGGGRARVPFSQIEVGQPTLDENLLIVDEAIQRLAKEDSRKGAIVHLRFFGGLTVAETAEALELSVGTIEREWRFIKAWLHVELQGSESD